MQIETRTKLSNNDAAWIVYRQLSVDIKIKFIRLQPVLLTHRERRHKLTKIVGINLRFLFQYSCKIVCNTLQYIFFSVWLAENQY